MAPGAARRASGTLAASAGRRGGASTAAAAATVSGGRSVGGRASDRVGIDQPRAQREMDGERRSAPRARRRRDVAAVLGHDLAGDEEAESAARVLGGEEGVEDLLDVLGRDTRTRVADRHRAPALAAVLLAAGRDLDAAVGAAGLERVQEEVHQHLLHLRLVDHHVREVRLGVEGDRHIAPARLGLEQARDLRDQLVQVRRHALRRGGTREGEEIVDEGADALDLAQGELAELGAELLVRQALGQELDEGAHRDQRVADLVCHAGGEHAEGGEPVGAPEQLARLPQLRRLPFRRDQLCERIGDPGRERALGGRERRASGAREEEEPAHTVTRADGQGEAPRARVRRLARSERRGRWLAVHDDGHERAPRKLLDEEGRTLEPEHAPEQRYERFHSRRGLGLVPPRSRPPSSYQAPDSPRIRPATRPLCKFVRVVCAGSGEVNSRGLGPPGRAARAPTRAARRARGRGPRASRGAARPAAGAGRKRAWRAPARVARRPRSPPGRARPDRPAGGPAMRCAGPPRTARSWCGRRRRCRARPRAGEGPPGRARCARARARRGQGTPPRRGIFRVLGQPVKVEAAPRGAELADGVWGARRSRAGVGAQRAQRASSGRAPRRWRPAPRGAELADGVWGHRSSAARAAREQRTGPQECLCYGMGMDDSLLESLDAGVLTLTLNRPARRNALDEALITRLHRRLAAASDDAAVRAVVLTGAGGAFSSGADLKEAARALTGDLFERGYNPVIRAIRRMPKPVIAAVDGVATGYGASLALAADIRLASERARLSLIFVRVGLTLDGGASWFLPRLVGLRAYELAMTGELVDAAEAYRIGLVNHVYPAAPFAAEVTALARRP